MKPEMMGGGSNSFKNITFNDMGGISCNTISSDGTTCTNENGMYVISGTPGNSLLIEAVPSRAGGAIAIRICEDDAKMGDYSPDATGAGDAPDAPAC